MGSLLNKNNGAIKFEANQEQKDLATAKLVEDLTSPDSAFIIPEGETAFAIATDAVNQACGVPLIVCNETALQQIYRRASRVIKSWANTDEQTENDNIAKLEAVKEKLSDCLHISLDGSPKQIAWAESLRLKKLEGLAIEVLEERMSLEAAAKSLSTSSAKWFIDTRVK